MNYEDKKEHEKKVDKIQMNENILFFVLSILLLGITIFIFKDKNEFYPAFFLIESLFAFVFFMIIDVTAEDDKNLETDNCETEEKPKKVSEFENKNFQSEKGPKF